MRHSLLCYIDKRYRALHTFAKMGRRKRQHRQNNFNKQKNPYPQQGTNERNYTTTVKENFLFKTYYAGLGIMAPEEVEDFYNQMKEPLPVTFRITGYKSQAKELMKIMKNQFLDGMVGKAPLPTTTTTTSQSGGAAPACADPDTGAVASGGISGGCDGGAGDGDGEGGASMKDERAVKQLTAEDIKPPKCLTWYPDGLAWQLDLSRKAIRSLDVLSKLHQFLVSETETGNISRQEAVSMIPPLVLDVQSDSRVLDMCAAPGSKTAQLIEYLHKDENSVPEGVVVANDKENKRCYLMVHQIKRLASPCCMILNHDAAFFPKLRTNTDPENPEHMLFNRVLADVPCSGDGTMRKNIDIWKKWHPAMGNSLHGLQLKILKRGLELLEVGGRLVYSTCSMQPTEDEAVIAEMLRKCEGSVKLVDISSHLPDFKTVPGLSTWRLMSKQGQWLDDYDSVPPHFKGAFAQSMFPPTAEEAQTFNLNLCHRILPHHQDTGGFFVAALVKVGHLPWSKEARLEREEASKAAAAAAEATVEPSEPAEESGTPMESTTDSAPAQAADSSSNNNATNGQNNSQQPGASNPRKRKGETEEGPQPKKMDLKGYKEDPFLFLNPDDPIYPPIKEFYGLPDGFPVDQLLYRSETGVKRALYFVNKATRQIVKNNEGRVRFINMGVKFVTRSPSPLVPDCDFRITQECIGSLRDTLSKRVVPVTKRDAIIIFKEENPFINKLSDGTQEALNSLCPGSVVFLYKPTDDEPEPACELAFCGWRGKMSVRCFVPKFERAHGLRLFGQDLAQIQAEVAQMKEERRVRQEQEALLSPPNTDGSDPQANAAAAAAEEKGGTSPAAPALVDDDNDNDDEGGAE